MNKRSHIMIADKISGNLKPRHRFFLKVGSILPDILVYTYLSGHTWYSSFEKTEKGINSLLARGKMNCISFLRLGYILHYIEDYFTFPHNLWYNGTLREHIKYEKDLCKYIEEKIKYEREYDIKLNSGVVDFITKKHLEYMHNKQGFENDFYYITNIAAALLMCFKYAFAENEGEFAWEVYPEIYELYATADDHFQTM